MKFPIMQKWTKLYSDAMAESNAAKLTWLLDDAIEAVLDQIEDSLTPPKSQHADLTIALSELRSRRVGVYALQDRRTAGPSKP
jgi:hypothetical protein